MTEPMPANHQEMIARAMKAKKLAEIGHMAKDLQSGPRAYAEKTLLQKTKNHMILSYKDLKDIRKSYKVLSSIAELMDLDF